MLADFCDNTLTDKNSVHSYIDVYESLFLAKKDSARRVLEIGVGDLQKNGGSAKLWAGYFEKAEVHIVDIIEIDRINPDLYAHPRIHLHASNDAYNANFFTNAFLSKGVKCDILIDDGPHTLESMVKFLQMYSQILKEDGILVIEDVQDFGWIRTLEASTPDHMKPFIQVYDIRNVKGRYDDILFVINLTQPPSSSTKLVVSEKKPRVGGGGGAQIL
jgi:hypothetical protein